MAHRFWIVDVSYKYIHNNNLYNINKNECLYDVSYAFLNLSSDCDETFVTEFRHHIFFTITNKIRHSTAIFYSYII